MGGATVHVHAQAVSMAACCRAMLPIWLDIRFVQFTLFKQCQAALHGDPVGRV
jgi:hypothetical protein